MTYVRANGTFLISDCPGGAPSGTGAFGELPAPDDFMGLGADPVADPASMVKELKRQINRFLEPTTPPELRLSTAGPLAVTDTLDLTTAIYLQAIVLRRATGASYAGLPKEQQDILSSAHLLTDLNWVVQHLPDAIALVKGYADSKGLAPARPSSMLEGLPTSVKVIGAVAVGWLLLKGMRKRGGR